VLLPGLLEFHRSTLLFKCAGLDAESLALRPLPFSNLSLLGLVRHLSKVERIWLRERFRGEAVPRLYSTPDRPDADFEDAVAVSAQADYERLLAEQEQARAIAAGAAMDETFLLGDGRFGTLRFIHAHLVGEYARHNGHADMLRQAIDGVTGA
jgi:hypothetical protein